MKFWNDLGIYIQRKLLKNNSFTVISDDCWGAEVYRNFNLTYRTPFVGLFVMAPCFIKMLHNLEFYISSELTFTKESKYEDRNTDRKNKGKFYPIGLLNNEVEIHFLHYDSEKSAEESWTRRCNRINWQNLFIKFDSGKNQSTYDLLKEYDSLPFKNKICLSKEEFPEIKCSIFLKDWQIDGAKMYLISLGSVNVISWLNNNKWRPTIGYLLLYKIFIQNSEYIEGN